MGKQNRQLPGCGAVGALLPAFALSVLLTTLVVACGNSSDGGSTSSASSAGLTSSAVSSGGDGGEASGASSAMTGSGGSAEGGGGGTSVSSSGAGGEVGPSASSTVSGSGGNSSSSSSEGGGGAASVSGSGGVGGMEDGGSAGSGGEAGAGGALLCAADQKICASACVQKDDPEYGCGEQGCDACPPAMHATVSCGGEFCLLTCESDFGNCDKQGQNGCETDLLADAKNCGNCGKVCGANESCKAGTCQSNKQSFSCSNWKRDPLFDQFKIDGTEDVELVGGIWGTSANNIYVTAATYAKGLVAHWDGSAWKAESLVPTPTKVFGIWGSSSDDIWAAGMDDVGGLLFHRQLGSWTSDVKAPSTIQFTAVWGSSISDVWLLGQDAGYGRLWHRDPASGNWMEIILPVLPFPHSLTSMWGLDKNHVFITGYHLDNDSNPDKGILLYYNGIKWSDIAVPILMDCIALYVVAGTSMDDLYLSGLTKTLAGAVYHLTGSMNTWLPFTNQSVAGYGPVWSKYPGTFLASGYQPPAQAGALRLTTGDQMTPVTTYAVDNMAYNPVGFWVEPGTTKVHFVHVSSPDNQVSGHYTGDCQ